MLTFILSSFNVAIICEVNKSFYFKRILHLAIVAFFKIQEIGTRFKTERTLENNLFKYITILLNLIICCLFFFVF